MKWKDSGNSVLYDNGQIIFIYTFHQAKFGSCNFLFAGVNRVFQVNSWRSVFLVLFVEIYQICSIKYVVLRIPPLAPFNAKCMFLILKFLTELKQELSDQTVYPHFYYCLPKVSGWAV